MASGVSVVIRNHENGGVWGFRFDEPVGLALLAIALHLPNTGEQAHV